MRSHRGFTLMEVVVALGVVLIIGSFFFQGRTNLMQRPQVDIPTVDWYLMLRELENPDHQFAVTTGASDREMLLISHKNHKKYLLAYLKQAQKIELRSGEGGWIIMMNHVKKFYFDRNHVMTITTNRGETYKARLLIPDEGKVTDDSSLGNHLTLSR